jgi:twitching motility protein PilT
MAKIDVYLKSIEKFGASAAILTSNQAVTMRFPQGDRHATQVTPHELLVGLVREVAPPAALDQIDKNRPAKFDMESAGTSYTLSVTPKPGSWQVLIELGAAAPAPSAAPARPMPRAATGPTVADAGEMTIERGQYAEAAPRSTSGSPLLDQLTSAARSARATDVYLATGVAPMARLVNELVPIGEGRALDAETISREIGIVAPADQRGAWTEKGIGMFTYSDGVGRVRATLTRDHRGPGASLRLLVSEPPVLERLGIGREAIVWLDAPGGLILVAGPSGSGKTTVLAALVRALADKRRRVVTFEDPIEIVHATSAWVSQRAIGEHVPSISVGVAAAMREAVDAIVIGSISTVEAATAAIEAVAAGHLVLATIAASTVRHAANQLVDLLPYDRRDLARGALDHSLLGTIAPILKGNGRTYEVLAGRSG